MSYELQPCNDQDELQVAAKLRYEAYRNVDAINENTSGTFIDAYDGMDNARTCLVYEDNSPVASLRACVYSRAHDFLQIPSFEVYKEDIAKSIGLDKVIVESNRFVISPSKIESKVLFKIPFRFIILNLHKFKGDFIITAVREKHVPLYRRFLFMEPISGLKKYPGINVDMVLMAGDCRKDLQRVINKEDFYQVSQDEVDDYSLTMDKEVC